MRPSNTIAPLLGVPQQRFSDPFPGGLVPVTGKTFGRYTNLGGPTTWYQQDFTPGVNDRINVSVQRQLPGQHPGRYHVLHEHRPRSPYNYDLNQVDPRIGYSIGNAMIGASCWPSSR